MDYQARIASLQATLAEQAILVEEAVNLRYLTGLELSAGALVVCADEALLFVDGRYKEVAQCNAPVAVADLDTAAMLKWLADKRCRNVSVAQESTSIGRYRALEKQALQHGIAVQAEADLVAQQRMRKDAHEIEILRRAGWLTVRGIEHIFQQIKPGISEAQLAWELEVFLRSIGADGLSFEAIVAFGPNGSRPHHRAGATTYRSGMPVLIDAGAKFKGYCGDCTRCMVPAEAPPEIHRAHDAVQEAVHAAIAACEIGLPVRELDRVARMALEAHGLESYFTHSLGHGLGLEVHEAPSLRQTAPAGDCLLQPGMVITIEPGVYLPGIGGIRLEEMVLITDAGPEIMTTWKDGRV